MGKTKTINVSEQKEDKKAKKKAIAGVGLKGGERIKTVEAGPIVEPKEGEKEKIKTKKAVKPRTRGKKYQEAKAKVQSAKLYPLDEAIKLVKETSYSSFNATVELHLVVKKEGLTASVSLPHSTGKTKKVEIATDETVKKLEKGKIDFDLLLATPEMMAKLVPFARLLGPKGLMPNPKNGTLIKSEAEAKKFSTDLLAIKTERKAPLIHLVVGKTSMKEAELAENTDAILEAVGKRQIIKAFIKSTMGPSVKLEIS